MKIAACSSITFARLARLMSMPISSRSTATVDSRSSHSAMARSVSLEKLRAKARVDCARGPSLPSMLMGRPSTKPAALRSAASIRRRVASAAKVLRVMVSTPVARRRSGSLDATPMVLVPRSSPISAPRAGNSGAISTSGRIGAGIGVAYQSRGCDAKRAVDLCDAATILRPAHVSNGTRVMQITWFGHSAFRLDFAGNAVLIDPFFTGNPAFVSDKAAAMKGVTQIVLTHGHGDHVGDALDIAKANSATVTANYDLGMWLVSKGLEKLNPMNTGGTTDLGSFTVTLVRADHSSGDIVNGTPIYLGNPCGAIIKAKGEPIVYHMGDTDIFSDMALIAEIHQPKVAMVPIGDRFTMSPSTAALAVKRFFKLDTVVPCHYGSFPIWIESTADKFVADMKGHATKVVVPEKGKPFTV